MQVISTSPYSTTASMRDHRSALLTECISIKRTLKLGNDLAYILYLPTATATAWFHKKLPAELLQEPLPDLKKSKADLARFIRSACPPSQ
ncbi:MAG TPA: hypothetical protein VN829_13585 [Dongiaceae bacterium]|nr:hypothetical protein [Dongiaceae bacterium]